jgi:hypothetical protein
MTDEESGVRDTLAACGLLKFFECPLIWAQEFLLQFLIQMWSLDLHCFMVRGEKLTFTAVEDIYFLMGLPFWGTPLPAEPVVLADGQLVVLGQRYSTRENFMSGSVVSIGVMDALVHHCVATMVVRVYGSLATQRISGGQLRIMERALAGEHFSWGLMLHAKMVGQARQVSSCRLRGVFLWVGLGGMVSGEGAYVAPESIVGCTWCARAVTAVVVDDFDSPWWWGGWPLFHGRGCTGVASYATDYTMVPILRGGLPG